VVSQEAIIKATKQPKKRSKKASNDQQALDGEGKKPPKRKYSRKNRQADVA
jgi:hypothetical protein